MRNKELNFTVDEERALKILNSPDQIIILNDENGNWQGDAINKSEIIGTKLDKEKTRDENYKNGTHLEAPKESKSPDEIKDLFKKYRPSNLKPIDETTER